MQLSELLKRIQKTPPVLDDQSVALFVFFGMMCACLEAGQPVEPILGLTDARNIGRIPDRMRENQIARDALAASVSRHRSDLLDSNLLAEVEQRHLDEILGLFQRTAMVDDWGTIFRSDS